MLVCSFFGILLVCLASAQNGANKTPLEEEDAYYPSTDWSDTFDWKLLKAFSLDNKKNVLISPITLKLVLALLYEGSSGNTAKEFQTVLQFPVQKQSIREKFQNVLTALNPTERKQFLLNLGTRIFMDSTIKVQRQFLNTAANSYKADVAATNFSDPIRAANEVNSWIDTLTNGRVSQLVSPSDLTDALMIIGNGIYFKGTWRHQFPRERTKTGGFYVSPTTTLNVPFMSTTDKFYYLESNDLDAKILRLPYQGSKFSFFIVLPNAKAGLDDLIRNINLPLIKRELYLVDQVPVEVCIPKFKFNYQARFNNVLQEFGLKQMFQNTASFSGIGSGISQIQRKLVVSDIIQKTGLELDEEGSTVYAATEVQVGNKFGDADNIFNATHPFLFFIEEESQGSILFIGKVENPLESDSVPLGSRFGDQQGAEPQNNLQPNLQPNNPEHDAVVRRFNYFDLELLQEFSETSRNIFISPASIKVTLALILEGAKGQTAQEIGNALRIDDIYETEIRNILGTLLFDLNDKRSPNTSLETANAIFVNDKLHVEPSYVSKVSSYNALVANLDFTKPASAANVINQWGSNVTHGIIKTIVDEGFITPETCMIISNALYFKGKWKTAFDAAQTQTQCFHSLTNKCANTQFMQVSDSFNYNFDVNINAHAIELPYQGDSYSMLILVPTTGNIKTLARDISHTHLNNIVTSLRVTDLVLEMPKFEIEYTTDLVSSLKAMKIRKIFEDNANLTGIINQANVKISNMIHKTKIEVDEQGTVAAAATSAIVVPLMGSQTQKITVNHPFIFFIYHKESKNIIFEGIFVEPAVAPLKVPVPQARFAQNVQYGRNHRQNI